MSNYLNDLVDVLAWCWNILSGGLFLTSLVIVPFVFPLFGIYLVRKNKKFLNIPGKVILITSLLILLMWVYYFLGLPCFQYRQSFSDVIHSAPYLLIPLLVFYISFYFLFEKNPWIKFASGLTGLVGFYFYVMFFLAKMFVGS